MNKPKHFIYLTKNSAIGFYSEKALLNRFISLKSQGHFVVSLCSKDKLFFVVSGDKPFDEISFHSYKDALQYINTIFTNKTKVKFE